MSTTLWESTVLALLLGWLLLPLALLALAGWSVRFTTSRQQQRCWLAGQRVMVAAFIVSACIGGLLMLSGAGVPIELADVALPLGLYPDGLAVWMALLISFLGVVLLRFAQRYLQGDRGQARFLPWCLVVLASVMLLVVTHHLLVMLLAWVSVSVALHRLLLLYPERQDAQQAAWQKFMVSRLGDAALMAVVGLLYYHYGSFHLPEILAAADMQQGSGDSGWALSLASVSLACAALCKCAQLPLHGWLMRVMEAPTPVSALLHAGVINLGGFVWLRLYPLFEGVSIGHVILVVVGGTTAIVAVLAMMTQTSIKHALAWSTCAQMGFMLFEIGLGAYTLALAHLLAHSLYKAHAFLSSGRTVHASLCPRLPLASLSQRVIAVSVTAAVAATILGIWPALVSHHPVLGALLVMAVGGALLGMPAGLPLTQRVMLCVLALTLVPLYALIHALLAPALPQLAAPFHWLTGLLGAVMVVVLLTLSLLVLQWPSHPRIAVWRLHISQGLYLDAVLQRWLLRAMPRHRVALSRYAAPRYPMEGELS